jgi:hypothetical protein
MKYFATKRFLVAKNQEGKFLALLEGGATTSPHAVSHPAFAKHITPYVCAEYKSPKPAEYYFENSPRMRAWLEGYEMVEVEIEYTAKIV